MCYLILVPFGSPDPSQPHRIAGVGGGSAGVPAGVQPDLGWGLGGGVEGLDVSGVRRLMWWVQNVTFQGLLVLMSSMNETRHRRRHLRYTLRV